MSLEALFALAFVGAALCAVLYAWFHRFITGRQDKYGRGPGHDQRGAERDFRHISDPKRPRY